MINDQLTRRERIRLESLNMALRMPSAVSENVVGQVNQAKLLRAEILSCAEEVERWLLAADQTGH